MTVVAVVGGAWVGHWEEVGRGGGGGGVDCGLWRLKSLKFTPFQHFCSFICWLQRRASGRKVGIRPNSSHVLFFFKTFNTPPSHLHTHVSCCLVWSLICHSGTATIKGARKRRRRQADERVVLPTTGGGGGGGAGGRGGGREGAGRWHDEDCPFGSGEKREGRDRLS